MNESVFILGVVGITPKKSKWQALQLESILGGLLQFSSCPQADVHFRHLANFNIVHGEYYSEEFITYSKEKFDERDIHKLTCRELCSFIGHLGGTYARENKLGIFDPNKLPKATADCTWTDKDGNYNTFKKGDQLLLEQ
eukprot:scaffold145298_cov36-Cyclotella_meneghiniana.AAC.2